jgi:hypothetical protein
MGRANRAWLDRCFCQWQFTGNAAINLWELGLEVLACFNFVLFHHAIS